jgi:methylmalonyl-CoA mutase C-terminal domain/subunit
MTGDAAKICAEALAQLESLDAAEVPLFVGGVVRKEHLADLKEMGVAAVFTAGASLAEITGAIQELAVAGKE